MLFFPAAKRLLIGLTLASLAACSGTGLGGPKYSLEELKSYYGAERNLLITAATRGSLEHVKSLMRYDPSKLDISNAFDNASEAGHSEIVKLLYNKDLSESQLFRSLVYAIELGENEIARFLLNKNSDLVWWFSNGKTSLVLSLRNDSFDIAEMILETGFDVNGSVTTDDGNKLESAIIYLAKRGELNVERATWLINNGVDVNSVDDSYRGKTALDFILQSNKKQPELVKLLLANGAETGEGCC